MTGRKPGNDDRPTIKLIRPWKILKITVRLWLTSVNAKL